MDAPGLSGTSLRESLLTDFACEKRVNNNNKKRVQINLPKGTEFTVVKSTVESQGRLPLTQSPPQVWKATGTVPTPAPAKSPQLVLPVSSGMLFQSPASLLLRGSCEPPHLVLLSPQTANHQAGPSGCDSMPAPTAARQQMAASDAIFH